VYESYAKVHPLIINGTIKKEPFREENLRVLPILIEAAAEVNRKRGTQTMFNHVLDIKLSSTASMARWSWQLLAQSSIISSRPWCHKKISRCFILSFPSTLPFLSLKTKEFLCKN
jgi:hypothetical protein